MINIRMMTDDELLLEIYINHSDNPLLQELAARLERANEINEDTQEGN